MGWRRTLLIGPFWSTEHFVTLYAGMFSILAVAGGLLWLSFKLGLPGGLLWLSFKLGFRVVR